MTIAVMHEELVYPVLLAFPELGSQQQGENAMRARRKRSFRRDEE